MLFKSLLIAASAFVLVPSAFAHETQQFRIGEADVTFVVGSLNEPVTVDDKSGVEVSISRAAPHGDENHDEAAPHDHETLNPMLGLDQVLQVEVSAGDKKRIFPLSPIYGEPGRYKAVFFPTVQTTYTYRFFGELDGAPIDLSFTCNPAGHPVTAEETTPLELSPNVTRVLKKGAFGCPTAKADLGFPEPSSTIQELRATDGATPIWIISVVALALSLVALLRRRKSV